MIIAVLSDSHDNIWKLDAALELMDRAEAIIHCGDLCSPFMIKHLGEGARGRPVHIVWGNNDGDVRLIMQVAAGFPNIALHGESAELSMGGLRVAVNHYPHVARPLAASGAFDLVCYGHDHTAYLGDVGRCTLLNPGEIMGLKGKTSFALFDTGSREVEFVEVRLPHEG